MSLYWIRSNGSVEKCTTALRYGILLFKRFVSENHYEVLKLPKTCTTKEIREAFISLSKKNHPDKHIGDPTMHNRFIKINEAYSVLINPVSRRNYDIDLKNEKKLKPPSPSPVNHPQESVRTKFYSSYDEPRTWGHYDHSKDYKYTEDSYYGVKGVKKMSNAAILVIILIGTLLGVGLQLLAIRNSFLRSREQMLEKSRKYSMLHSLAREKAKRYGKEHQIEMLKKTLQATCDIEPDAILNGESTVDPFVTNDLTGEEEEDCNVCEVCRRKKQSL